MPYHVHGNRDGAEHIGQRHQLHTEPRRQLDPARLEAVEESIERLLTLHASQERTHAEMRSVAEGEVPSRIFAIDSKAVGIREDAFVPVRRSNTTMTR